MTTSDKHNPAPPSNDAASLVAAPSAAPTKKPGIKKAPASKPKAVEKSVKVADKPKKVAVKKPKTTLSTSTVATKSAAATSAATTKSSAAGEKTTAPKKTAASKTKAIGTASVAKTITPHVVETATSAIVADAVKATKKSKTVKLIDKNAAINQKHVDVVSLIQHKLVIYSQLMRLDRPIGILLLLWPTLWSLWLAAKGMPSLKNLLIFSLGVVIMRSAGCVINDFADRKIDSKVKRTQDRPLATGAVTNREAIMLFVVLCVLALGLVLLTNPLTIKLSVGGLLLAFCYPFMKRHTHLPQIVLGAAFAWSIPMAFAAEAGELPQNLWLIYLAVVLWTVVYDTFYAMVDRDDDIKIGVKSTAILFGEQDRFITGVLQVMTLYTLFIVGNRFELGGFYYTSVVIAAGFFVYQQWLIRFRARAACFSAFLNNNWVGLAIFVGIAADFALR